MRLAVVLGAALIGCASDAEPARVRETAPAAAAASAATPVGASTAGTPLPLARIDWRSRDRIDAAVQSAVERGDVPGAVVVIGRRSEILFRRAYGARALEPERVAASESTLFDLASLTKPVATATSVMLLASRRRLSLDDRASRYVPELAASGAADVTLRQLLLHTSGLPADDALSDYAQGSERGLARALSTRPVAAPGERTLYSDLGFIVLGEVVRRVAGHDLAAFTKHELFEPLALEDTGFLPAAALASRAAPTERRDGAWLVGRVHDPRAALLGGVAGHAGLFSTADDLARFARMLLGGGEIDGKRLLAAASVREMLRAVDVPGGRRALGWAVPDGAPTGSVAHSGFTGTWLRIDASDDLFVVVLSSRLHPDGHGNAGPLSHSIHATARDAARRLPVGPTEDAGVLTGIDVLRRDGFHALAGARVALITSSSGRARDGTRTSELFARAPGLRLVRLLAPEHGLEADAEGPLADVRDRVTGVPVLSLFGPRDAPDAAALDGVDTLVFDVQDAGTRFYTYLATMHRALAVAARRGLRFVVLDRPDPLGGERVEGPLLDADRIDAVNHHRLPVIHGMTAGEMARLLDGELGFRARLEVIPCEGWRRSMAFGATSLEWVDPSPNLRSPLEALLYPTIGLFERGPLSVGRGTPTPFELVGAPFIHGEKLAEALGSERLPGLRVEPARFVPSAAPYRGRSCGGIRLRVDDPAAFRPLRTALALARALARLHPTRFRHEALLPLLGHRATITALYGGATPDVIEASWQAELASFQTTRRRYLLY